MTNNQKKLCKIIVKEKYLNRILSTSGIKDYLDLQYCFEPNMLDFSDYEMNENTIVTLTTPLLEEFEKECRNSFREWFTWILSICAIIISIISLFCS